MQEDPAREFWVEFFDLDVSHVNEEQSNRLRHTIDTFARISAFAIVNRCAAGVRFPSTHAYRASTYSNDVSTPSREYLSRKHSTLRH